MKAIGEGFVASLVFLFLFSLPMHAGAGESPISFSGIRLMWDAESPLELTADRMEFDSGGRSLRFTGRVKVNQAAFELLADSLNVTVDGKGRILDLVAEGGIQLIHQEWKATAGKLTYKHVQRSMVLSDNPRIASGENTVSGKIIRFHVDENRVVVESAAVNFLLPGDAEEKKEVPVKPLPDRTPKSGEVEEQIHGK